MEHSSTGHVALMQKKAGIVVAVKTDLGNVRVKNEDSADFFCGENEDILREKGCLFFVADGMGGHLAGEVASKMALDIVSTEYFKPSNKGSLEKILAHAFKEANRQIYEHADKHAECDGMGTTCTALVLLGDVLYYAHSGDSRAYLYRNDLLTRITEDHTYVQELVNKGELSPAEARKHPHRNILTSAMGTSTEFRVDTGKWPVKIEKDDRLLICTDGLHDALDEHEIARVLGEKPVAEAADEFVHKANSRGGLDNITVIVVEKN